MDTIIAVALLLGVFAFLPWAMTFSKWWLRFVSAFAIAVLAALSAGKVGSDLGRYFQTNRFYNSEGPHAGMLEVLEGIRTDLKAERIKLAGAKLDVLADGWREISIDPQRPEQHPRSYRVLFERVSGMNERSEPAGRPNAAEPPRESGRQ